MLFLRMKMAASANLWLVANTRTFQLFKDLNSMQENWLKGEKSYLFSDNQTASLVAHDSKQCFTEHLALKIKFYLNACIVM